MTGSSVLLTVRSPRPSSTATATRSREIADEVHRAVHPLILTLLLVRRGLLVLLLEVGVMWDGVGRVRFLASARVRIPLATIPPCERLSRHPLGMTRLVGLVMLVLVLLLIGVVLIGVGVHARPGGGGGGGRGRVSGGGRGRGCVLVLLVLGS